MGALRRTDDDRGRIRRRDPKIRLAQLSEALLRDCRFISGIKLHTQNQTVEQAARLFVEKGFQEPANAHEEARRGAYDPTYLYYTAGKLQIYKLRKLQAGAGRRVLAREVPYRLHQARFDPDEANAADPAERRSVAAFVTCNHLFQILGENIAFEIDLAPGLYVLSDVIVNVCGMIVTETTLSLIDATVRLMPSIAIDPFGRHSDRVPLEYECSASSCRCRAFRMTGRRPVNMTLYHVTVKSSRRKQWPFQIDQRTGWSDRRD